MKKLFIVLLIILGVSLLLCQSNDTLILKDGTIIHGRISQYEAGRYVIIILPDGSQKMFNWDVISSVDQQTSETQDQNQKSSGNSKFSMGIKHGLQYDKTLPEDKLREFWQSQGGHRMHRDFTVNYVGMKMELDTDTPGVKTQGHGGGLTGSASWLYFSPPDYPSKRFYTFSTKLGVAYALTVNGMKTKMKEDIPPSYEMNIENDYMITNVDIGGLVGANIGLGAFPLSQKWIGAIMGLSWRPLFRLTGRDVITTITTNHPYIPDSQQGDNYTSQQADFGTIEYSVDFGTIKALTDRFAPRSALKINLIYVPPIGKNKMTMWMVGIGTSKYR